MNTGIQDMIGTYEERKVASFKKGYLFVSTAAVYDSKQPYETAVAHRAYNFGKLVIVEMYDTREAAEKGHKKWVKKMTCAKLPKQLMDVSSSYILLQLAESWGVKPQRIFKREEL